MSIVKYSTSNIPNTIRANNVAVGINNVNYGPTNTTGFYSGSNVPSGGYVVYRFPSGDGNPNVYVAQNDTELINLAGRRNATTVAQAISHINGLSNTIIMDRNYENIVTDGLVLCLDAGTLMSYLRSGTTWRDISGNGNNGTLINGPTFNSGNGGSIVFDGVNDYINLGRVSNLEFTNIQAFTISMWILWTPSGVNLTNAFCYGDVAGVSPAQGDEGYYIALDNGVIRSRSFLFDYFDGNTFRGIQGNANTIPINTWFNFTVVSGTNNNANNMMAYVNGTLINTTIRGNFSPTSINYNSSSANVAARDGAATLNGRVSSTFIYNRALSTTEILQNYNATKSRYGL